MILTLQEFIETPPDDIFIPGDAIGLWISESVAITGSEWNVLGITIPINTPTEEIRNELKQVQTIFYSFPNYSSPFYSSSIVDRKQLSEHYYFKTDGKTKIPSGSVALGGYTSEQVRLFFEPNLESIFNNSDYDVLNNNVSVNKRSKYALKLLKQELQLTPTNLTTVISSSIDSEYKSTLGSNEFAEIDDSMYDSKTWTISRYEGSENRTTKVGDETALAFYSFNGVLYASNTPSQSIALVDNIQRDVKKYYYNILGNLTPFEDYLKFTTTELNQRELSSCGFSPLGIPQSTYNTTSASVEVALYSYINDAKKNTNVDIDVRLYFLNSNVFGGIVIPTTVDLTIPAGGNSISYIYTSSVGTCSITPDFTITTSTPIRLEPLSGFYDVVQEGENQSQNITQNRTFIYQDEKGTKNIVKVPEGSVYSVDSKNIYRVLEGRVVQIESST